jgi:FAD binding domain of DNA photolyase
MPKQYLLEPWKAPEAVQKKAQCIIGKDYPAPIVEHNAVYKENILRRVCNYSRGFRESGVCRVSLLSISLSSVVCRIKAAYDADKLSAKRKATS